MRSCCLKALPPQMGNPAYVPTTIDVEFIDKLKSQKWTVVYFAPGACRFSAQKLAIPGGSEDTRGWTLEEYRALVYKYQGKDVRIVEISEEMKAISLLKDALADARETI